MAETKRDYYETLGISRTAGDDEIKKAYRKIAKECHPDLNPGDKEKEHRFKEANEAYEVLSDSQKKNMYDQYGHAGVDPSYGAGRGGGQSGFGFDDLDLGSIFESFFGGFGGSRSATGSQKGESIRASMMLSFEEAAFGCEKDVEISRLEACDTCEGTGATPGSSIVTCSVCRGAGQVRTAQRTPMGVFSSTGVCGTCNGKGKIIAQPCSSCKGIGLIRKRVSLTVKVPAGIDDRQSVPLRGQGSKGKGGGAAGDVLVSISVRPHPLFVRDGTTVHCEIPITFSQAALGCELEVPTLDGPVKYTLPEGTQPGTVFRFKGKGIPSLSGRGRGDQLVHIAVEIPKHLSKKQKEALLHFSEVCDEKNNPKSKSFFDKFGR